MELKFLVTILFSFALAFIIAPFFIGFLYKFNIRRISKPDLDDKLPDRALKLGTPIMGGALITGTVLFITAVLLRSWQMALPFSLILILGSLFGAIDEFINTIGRKGFSFAVRDAIDATISKNKMLWEIYKLMLVPWDLFKEVFRMMGSGQRGLKTHDKFLMQSLVAFVGAYWLYFVLGYSSVWIPLVGEVFIGWLFLPLIMFLALWYANAFGVTDGMDGLSAGLHAISFLGYGVLALIMGQYQLALFCAAIVGAELAFLYFNIHPARMEMSDVGTLPLGILFVYISVLLNREVTLLLIGGVFLIELLSSFIQVWSVKLRKKRVFLIAPIHHHFEKMGWHETKVTSRFWLFNSLLVILGLAVALL